MAGEEEGYLYGRIGSNPTVEAAAAAVAGLEGAERGLLTSSGMAAIHAAVVAHLPARGRLVASSALYGNTLSLFRDHIGPREGTHVELVDVRDLAAVERACADGVDVLYAETVANPGTTVADLPALAAIARGAGGRLIVDNTIATPLLCRPLEHGATVVVHSATKFLNGHHDVLAGVVCGSAADLAPVRAVLVDTGGVGDPDSAWLLTRGLMTLVAAPGSAARHTQALAEHLAATARRARRAVRRACRATPTTRSARPAARRPRRARSLPFEVEGGRAAARRVMDGVTLIERATSIGGHHQRHLPPRLHQPPPAHRRGARAHGHPRRADPARRRLRGRRGPRRRPGAGDPGRGVTLAEDAERRAASARRSPTTRRSRRSCGSPSSRTWCTSPPARRSCGADGRAGRRAGGRHGVLQPGLRPGHPRLATSRWRGATIWVAQRTGEPRARARAWCGRALWRAVGLTAAAFVVSIGGVACPLEPIFHGAESQGFEPNAYPGGAEAAVGLALTIFGICLFGPLCGGALLPRPPLRRAAAASGRSSRSIGSSLLFSVVALHAGARSRCCAVLGIALALLYELHGLAVAADRVPRAQQLAGDDRRPRQRRAGGT